MGFAEFKEELKWEWSWLAEWRSAHGKGGDLTVTVAMTREEGRLETCGVSGQLRGEADGGDPRPRGSGGGNESLRLGMGVAGGGESVMGTAPLPREL